MVVGNATTLTSPFVSHFSDVTLVESSESITWRTGNASLSADAVAIDSSETLEMVVGNATTLTSPFVSQFSDVTLVESSESITWRASNASLSSTILDIRNQNTTIMAYNEIEIVSPSIDMVGVVTLGNETTTGQLVILNGVRSDLMETITADGTTGELSSVSMVTGDLVATRLLPGTAANGSITANNLVLEYDSGLPEPSQITSTIGTDQTGTTVLSNGVQVGANSTAQLTAGVVAFTGLAVQATGMPSSFSTLSRADCTDPINPCSLTLTGSGPGVYALGINLPNIGNAIPEVYVDNIFYEDSTPPNTGEMIFLYQSGSTPVNFVANTGGNIAGSMPLNVTKTLQSGEFTMFLFVASEWSAFA
ncbi:hypothetical protein Naga_100126g1 [Nannochloropsis gaditana]|uniref:Uncharacterized protein n=1 Tax=Nannochloropsis gaditana TaxID=72520 RepID=W7TGH4_9STRA|nr:hypothetical protein Naga_100126g1 [Nannochloropsis gaditana]